MAKNPKSPLCPICKKKPAEREFVPFCSEQCRLIDLGHWFDGKYQVAPGSDRSDSVPPPTTPEDKSKI